MAGKRGTYSKIIIYDERRRYYYMWPQRNRPFLDDEIRDMGVGLLDQIRRAVQNTYGDVAVPCFDYSGFTSTADAFKVVENSGVPDKNFNVTCGTSLDHPAVLYAKGFYIFLSNSSGYVEYKDQMYSSDNIDLATETDKSRTLTLIPALTTPSSERIDIVYIDLHFEEVSSVSGTDSDVYRDSNLKNPIVGTDTSNRLRAVIDVRVFEGWDVSVPYYGTINENIFTHPEFLGAITGDDSDPTDNHYKIPIAVIYRHASTDVIYDADIVDLLTLYNKRIYSLEELTHRTMHGGYVQQDVDEKSLTGFQPQHPAAVVDESAFATGLNQGLGTEAFNTNAVTPRILSKDGKFFMDALQVGHATGVLTLETGPEQLHDGEVVGNELSVRKLEVGYGVTGITGVREYSHVESVVGRGETGRAILNVLNQDGATGSVTVQASAVHQGVLQNFYHMDYRGRIGLNTMVPGWSGPDLYWNVDRYRDGLFGETGVNIILDVKGSARVVDHLFVDNDFYVGRDAHGRTYIIPKNLSVTSPALFGYTGILSGFTGIQNYSPFTGSVAYAVFRSGVAAHGVTGTVGHGYTGASLGHYESYDSEGRLAFSIGDLGEEFDRVVMTLYGTDSRPARSSITGLVYVPYGIHAGDTVSYTIRLKGGTIVSSTYTLASGEDDIEGVRAIASHMCGSAGGFPPPNYYQEYRTNIPYYYYDEHGILITDYFDGWAYGAQAVDDTYGAGVSGLGIDHGKLVLKDMPEIGVEIDEIVSFQILNGTYGTTTDIAFTEIQCYGNVSFGGEQLNIKFAKLDLGEGADAWLFNGDVFFNGNGLLNRVTFSPNVMFRDDVFIYGTLFADQMIYNFANVGNQIIRNLLVVEKDATVYGTLSVGTDAYRVMQNLLTLYPDLKFYTRGNAQIHNLALETDDTTQLSTGNLYFSTQTSYRQAYIRVGGTLDSETDPFGIHLIDSRSNGLTRSDANKSLVIDFSDGNGNYGDVDLVLRGNILFDSRSSGGMVVRNLSVGTGVTGLNTSYALYCNGPAQINGVLEVEALRFIGAEAPEGEPTVSVPANISIIKDDKEEQANNELILREKKFTTNERVYLTNQDALGYPAGWEDPYTYWEMIRTSDYPIFGKWARDTLTYTEDNINALVAAGDPGVNGTNELLVTQITTAGYLRYAFNRMKIATLGTLHITWIGYAYDPSEAISGSTIQEYYFESPYFRDRAGYATLDWINPNQVDADNYQVRVTVDIIDPHPTSPNMFTIDDSIGIYIPKTNWYEVGADQTAEGYRSFSLFYPYEKVINKLNIVQFTDKAVGSGYPSPIEWYLALYPRLVKQRRLPLDTTETSNKEYRYQGEWDLDLVVFPRYVGRCANMIGKLYISYVQS